MAPKRSHATIEVTPASIRIFATATPAAPAPTISTSRSSILRSVKRQALIRAARVTIAVPCWSSWKTGMSSASCSRCSISKQRGEEMSSRLMPPNVGAMRITVSTISSTSLVARQIGKASTSANSLNSIALPSITGMAASGPMSPRPEHRGAVGDDGHRVRLDRVLERLLAVLGDRRAHARDARRVGHRQVVAALQRDVQAGVDLAAPVHLEGAVGDLDDLGGLHRLDGGDHLAAVVGAARTRP